MAAIWTPATVDPPLVIAQEDQINVDATITVVADTSVSDDVVTALSWSSTQPLPAQFAFTPTILAGVGTLALHIPNFVDIFQIVDIKYIRNKIPGICYRWADLPADAEELIGFHPDPQNVKNFPLSVTATFFTAPPETKTYIIQVFANYTLGKNLLMAAVDARR